ncbi:uncharacterized protein LACBIDRAFT_334515 [Laccaria bicolor S238N-H82]|uniref:Predicted protein n=1 Tax=Laccaria bicolor (strain S238N-H82 / ATCC MYA-4686) TaxID=486041 RepID=B0DZE6_LACBS|nr:uncharacterized protein LACBIDRAFT_334515 [Laccaria bicolor S238N-H82]EDR00002.1 predicted protein [Laccaria bicolor S238N-H82]|eukprot:XP_001889311.1 predicted protein [Laccaria bicolor S238N-H82]
MLHEKAEEEDWTRSMASWVDDNWWKFLLDQMERQEQEVVRYKGQTQLDADILQRHYRASYYQINVPSSGLKSSHSPCQTLHHPQPLNDPPPPKPLTLLTKFPVSYLLLAPVLSTISGRNNTTKPHTATLARSCFLSISLKQE